MPLIILPVQSEGIPSSGGGLPLGRTLPTTPPAPLQGDELKKLLTQQLEYYFSKDNLSSDKYLCELILGAGAIQSWSSVFLLCESYSVLAFGACRVF